MGIPLPSLHARVPDSPPNVLEQYGQILGIKDMLQRQKIRTMQVEEMQRQQADQMAVRTVLSDPSIDWSKPQEALATVTQKAVAAKVSPDALMKIRSSLMQNAQDFMQWDKARQDQTLADNDQMYQHATALLQAPPEQKEALYQQIRAGLIQEGKADERSLPPQYPGDQWTSVIRGSLGLTGSTFKLTLEQARRKSEEEKAAAEATIAQQEAAVSPEFLKREAAKHPETLSTDVKDYKFAQSQGYKGTFEQWQKQQANLKPRTQSTVVVQTVDDKGRPVIKIVPKVAGAIYEAQPTSTTRTMAESAPKVKGFIQRIRPLIEAQKQQLGPAAGRWSEFMTGKVGSPNPQFAKLRTDIGLLQTLLMRMHVGARGGVQLMDHFKSLIDSGKQSPENLQAALDEIEAYADQISPSGGGQGASAGDTPQGNDPFTKYGGARR